MKYTFNATQDAYAVRNLMKQPIETIAKEILSAGTPVDERITAALMLAKQAEDMCTLAEQTQSLVNETRHTIIGQYRLDSRLTFNPSTYGYCDISEDMLDAAVGIDDPYLRAATATVLAAQLYLNHQINALQSDITTPDSFARIHMLDAVYIDAFRDAAGSFYGEAGNIVLGCQDLVAANKLFLAANSIVGKIKTTSAPKPFICLQSLILNHTSRAALAYEHTGKILDAPSKAAETAEKILNILGKKPAKLMHFAHHSS